MGTSVVVGPAPALFRSTFGAFLFLVPVTCIYSRFVIIFTLNCPNCEQTNRLPSCLIIIIIVLCSYLCCPCVARQPANHPRSSIYGLKWRLTQRLSASKISTLVFLVTTTLKGLTPLEIRRPFTYMSIYILCRGFLSSSP